MMTRRKNIYDMFLVDFKTHISTHLTFLFVLNCFVWYKIQTKQFYSSVILYSHRKLTCVQNFTKI